VLLAAVAIDAGIARLRPSRRSAPAAAGDPAGGPAELVGAGTR
jgi:hypothetical protein